MLLFSAFIKFIRVSVLEVNPRHSRMVDMFLMTEGLTLVADLSEIQEATLRSPFLLALRCETNDETISFRSAGAIAPIFDHI